MGGVTGISVPVAGIADVEARSVEDSEMAARISVDSGGWVTGKGCISSGFSASVVSSGSSLCVEDSSSSSRCVDASGSSGILKPSG